jgi:hypothetical protein
VHGDAFARRFAESTDRAPTLVKMPRMPRAPVFPTLAFEHRSEIVRPDFGRIRIPDGRMAQHAAGRVAPLVHTSPRCDDLDDGAPINSLT